MHKTDFIWGGTWGGTTNFWGGMCPPRPPLGDATELSAYPVRCCSAGQFQLPRGLACLIEYKQPSSTLRLQEIKIGRIHLQNRNILIWNFAVVYNETGGLNLIWTLSTEIPTKPAHYKRAQLTT